MQRFFSSSCRALNFSPKKPWIKSFNNVLSLEPLIDTNPNVSDYYSLEPYELSNKLKEILKEKNLISLEQQKHIHNKLIEELTKYDFAVAAVHLKELQRISGVLTVPAFVQVIENNPGRVKSSWEFFVENYDLIKESDDALTAVLNKLIEFDPIDQKDGKKEMGIKDIARSFYVLNKIKDKSKISDGMWAKLINGILHTNTSIILPEVLTAISDINLAVLDTEELTDLQLYHLLSFKDAQSLYEEDRSRFLNLFSLVGTEKTVPITDAEVESYETLLKESEKISELLSMQPLPLINYCIPTEESFEHILHFIREQELDKKQLSYAKMMLRYLGIHKGDIKRALEYYHQYLMNHPSYADDLMYEVFLTFAYQSFESSNDKLLSVAETLIPSETSQKNRLNILRTLVLVKSKFALDECLEIFNANVQTLSKAKNSVTNTSDAALLTEALILAYLRNKDRDFAHVIFEGGTREKIFEGPTAVKRVKNILTFYGESLENENCTDIIDAEILRVLRSL